MAKKKEDTQSKNANSTDTVVTTDSNLSTIDANELDSIAESVVADDYMYKQCNGRYPDSDEETKLRKDCADNGFTDSQIDAAITKIAENCK